MSIYDDLNFEWDAYKVLGITESSNDETIKDAYKLKKTSSSPEEKKIIERSYSLIKNSTKRIRYALIKNSPKDSLDDIKAYGYKPIKTETNKWFKLITDSQSET